jgi:hypothetical protein
MPLAGIPDSKRRLMTNRLPKGPSWLLPASRAYHGLGIYTCCSSPDNWLECLGSLFYFIRFPSQWPDFVWLLCSSILTCRLQTSIHLG